VILVALGDSITAGTPLWDPDPHVRVKIGDRLDERSSWVYWAASMQSGVEFRNHGVNLEKAEQVAARLEAAVIGADALVVQSGVNDLVRGGTLEGAERDLRWMVRRADELGLRVSITELIPNNNFPELDKLIRELNRRIHALAANEGIPVLPFYRTLEDRERPGRIRPDWTNDGNQPSVEGHRRLGELAFRLP